MSTLKTLGALVLINAVIIAFYFLAPLDPKLALFAVLLLTLNYLFYRLFKARADNDLSKLENGVSFREVSKGVKLLRYAACALAFVSFITTAQGMSQFVFKGVEWQAYLASFAVQSILIVFSFLFFHFYVKINSANGSFPLFMSRIVTYCVVLLFTLSLVVSTTFSFVYIANNTYAPMRAKNSNIIIESFFSEEIARLRSVNEEIGKIQKAAIETDIKVLANELTRAAKDVEPESESALRRIVDANVKFKGTKYIRDSIGLDADDAFFTMKELNDIRSEGVAVEEYENAYEQFKAVKHVYDTKFLEYEQRFDYYTTIIDPNTILLDYTTDELQTEVETLNKLITQIEEEKKEISEIREKSLNLWLSPYRSNAYTAFDELKTSIEALLSFYNTYIPALNRCLNDLSENHINKAIISDLYSLVTVNEYDKDAVDRLREYLNKRRAEIALGDVDSELNNWVTFTQDFNSFIEYSELKSAIDNFSESNMSISYYILGENETHPEDVDNIKYLSEEEWKQARKEDFVQFVSLLKMLPDLEKYRNKTGLLSIGVLGDSSGVIEDYEPSGVLDSAYRYNRDLLEDINNIEKAFNYFKYDFKAMAIFSLALALFMDFASFLTGGFMFATTFFKKRADESSPEEAN